MRNIGAVYKRSLILKVLTLLIFLSIGYLIINFTYNKSSVVTKLSEKEITFIENLLYDGDRKTGQEEIKEVEEKVQDTTRILTSTPRNLQKAAKDNETGIVKQSKTHDKPSTVISKENEEPTKNSTVVRSTEKSKFTTVVPPKALTQMTELRDCFFIKNNNLPDVFDQTLQKENSIFFFDTACASFAAGKITIKARQACSIESAALSNPNFNVYLLFASPGQLKNGETQSDRLLKSLNQYKNIKMLHVDFEKLLKTIPPQYLRHNNIYESEDTLAATIEFFILRKYGGIFLNNDVLVVKSFKDFPSNFIGLDSDNVLASHVFAWRHFSNDTKNDIGNMTYSKKTSLIDMICGPGNIFCSSFIHINHNLFYPIKKNDWQVLFQDSNSTRSKKLLKLIHTNSYTVNIYDQFSRNNNVSKSSNVLYTELAKRYCPNVFSEIDNYF